MKNAELIFVFNNYDKIIDLKGAKLKYALIKNNRIILEELKVIEEIRKPSAKYQEFLNKQSAIEKKYKKDESKKDQPAEDDVDLTEEEVQAAKNKEERDEKSMEKEISDLKEKYKDEIKKQEEKQKEFSEMLERDITIKLHKIPVSCVTEDVSTEQMVFLSYFTYDDDQEKPNL